MDFSVRLGVLVQVFPSIRVVLSVKHLFPALSGLWTNNIKLFYQRMTDGYFLPYTLLHCLKYIWGDLFHTYIPGVKMRYNHLFCVIYSIYRIQCTPELLALLRTVISLKSTIEQVGTLHLKTERHQDSLMYIKICLEQFQIYMQYMYHTCIQSTIIQTVNKLRTNKSILMKVHICSADNELFSTWHDSY